MSRRSINWSAELSAFKADRSARSEVRCEPLKSYTAGKSLVAWRGRSGRRYVFGVYLIADIDASDLRDMVVLGVDADGDIVGAYGTCTMPVVMAMIDAGAVTLHLHSLCDTLLQRTQVAADLRPLAVEAA
jgi:hypothetical protein